MPKALTLYTMVTSGLLILIFGLDLAVKIPFQRANATMDLSIVISSGILFYLGWVTRRELK